ncbi:MAG TPA: RtcB family protein [Dehalococcoidia bacterium]|nr:RtcB family protein [Dehalococcoidia bacterium]
MKQEAPVVNYNVIEKKGAASIKAWTRGVPVEDAAVDQLVNVARLPFVHKWVAAMPDVHYGRGATVGSVIPTKAAIIPAAVGVDLGCGVVAARTSLKAEDLPDGLGKIRSAIEAAVPHGRTNRGGRGDKGGWDKLPAPVEKAWRRLAPGYRDIIEKYPSLDRGETTSQLGTLGSGNHFIEVCLDEADRVWIMLHSGSRGVGNRIGTLFIDLAKKDMRRLGVDLPDQDLAYLTEGSRYFDDYWFAVAWAQDFAYANRQIMLDGVIAALQKSPQVPTFRIESEVVNCHHNYVALETHYGEPVYVTRKGAVRAGAGEMGIIPGSMGAKSYIVRGKGSPESFESCSHGAGRTMSRGEAKRRLTLDDHIAATRGVECRKDEGVLDESPAAYKPIEAVMAAQADLVEIVHTLKQVVCVKG